MSPARRRLAALGSAALVAFVAGVAIGASDGGQHADPARAAIAPPAQALKRAHSLSIKRQIGELLMISFQGPGVPSYVKDALRAGRAGSVILFRGNAATPAQMRAVTRTLQHAGRGRVLIAVDQEGGSVRTLPWAHPIPAESAETTPARARAQAHRSGVELAQAGINIALAPVADVATGSAVRDRAFPGGATRVAAFTDAAVRGYRGTGVAPTLKHFPGLGAAARNTDYGPTTITAPRATLLARDVVPFRAGITAGASLVMASHALYTGLDRRNLASQSPAVITGLLRRRLGFGGVVITDSLEAKAVLRRSSLETAALRSLQAGADILLMTGPGSFPRVRGVLTVAAQRSAKFRARIADAAARVIALKASLGLGRPRR